MELPVAQTQADNHNVSASQTPKSIPLSVGKKHSRALWIVLLVFFAFVTTVFLTQRRETINWIEDYETGIELAKRQNKPALLCFFKQHTRFSSEMWHNVYSRPDVKEYVEANFIPILIDVDKQPEIAQRYDVDYYPTHYVEYPNTNQTDGPFLGEYRLFEFIKKPRSFTQKNSSPQ
jgi:hypothetical protein